jgi:RNA polymerase sigma-70 factor, ECF subfamily
MKGISHVASVDDRHPRTLIERCNRGERDAWEEFYRRYYGLVACAVKKLRSSEPDDTEDVVQDVFINLFRALKEYDPARSLEAYIIEIARRVRISRFRSATAAKRGGRAGPASPLDAHDRGDEGGYISIASNADNQEQALIKAQETRLLRKALEGISETCRKLLALRYDGGMQYSEMASILGLKEGTLRVKVQRCLSALAKSYDRSH